MARAISDEELQLKRRARRRLIGAIVLVTAIIVVLPMILDSEPRPAGQEVTVKIPSPDSGGFASKVVPLPAESRVPAKAPAPEQQAPSQEAKAPEVNAPPTEAKKLAAAAPEAAKEAPAPPLKAETEIAKPPPPKPQPAPKKEKAKPAAKDTGKFVVQVIALADAGRAKQMQEKITAAGIKSYTEVVKTTKGDVTRVRAGPFATRQQAEKARDQLKELGMSGNIATK